MTGWLRLGRYEYEYNQYGRFTGWYRHVDGRLADGKWPAWNNEGKVRYG